ncbi:TIGR03620 family F420-dependent LLM class oxidoreductase [Allokutzneria multivorans]|uniref:TIGR03620 family F420-dependent LLM class oxidoreductase n=1 Tax=Allokutzneria multivorans TaxID=1142134 RepID=A0ABP7QWH7_9PSEU
MGSLDGLDLGRFGIYTFDFEFQSAALVRESVREIEELGWPTVWIPELLGRDAFTHAAVLLSASERLNVVNGIARIWSREARWTHGASTLLADAFPDRHVLGLGFGGTPHAGVKPLDAMAAYLDELDAMDSPNPAPRSPVRRILAAYGPKMLELARDRAAGSQSYHVNVEHTAQSRDILGPQAFLGVEHAVLLETDRTKAREIARAHMHAYLTSPYNIAKFRRLGYSEEEIGNGGGDRLIDDFVYWGDLDSITEKLHAHLDAGADHVAVQVIGVEPGRTALPQWRALSEALTP